MFLCILSFWWLRGRMFNQYAYGILKGENVERGRVLYAIMCFHCLKLKIIAYWFVIIKKGEIVGNIILMMKIKFLLCAYANLLIWYNAHLSWLFGLSFCQFVVPRWREEVKRCKGAKRMSKSAQNKAPGRCSRRPGRPTPDRPSRQWASRKTGQHPVDHQALPGRPTQLARSTDPLTRSTGSMRRFEKYSR